VVVVGLVAVVALLGAVFDAIAASQALAHAIGCAEAVHPVARAVVAFLDSGLRVAVAAGGRRTAHAVVRVVVVSVAAFLAGVDLAVAAGGRDGAVVLAAVAGGLVGVVAVLAGVEVAVAADTGGCG